MGSFPRPSRGAFQQHWACHLVRRLYQFSTCFSWFSFHKVLHSGQSFSGCVRQLKRSWPLERRESTTMISLYILMAFIMVTQQELPSMLKAELASPFPKGRSVIYSVSLACVSLLSLVCTVAACGSAILYTPTAPWSKDKVALLSRDGRRGLYLTSCLRRCSVCHAKPRQDEEMGFFFHGAFEEVL